MALSASALAAMRATTADFRPDACTITRANTAVFTGTCRIVPKGQYQPVPGVPLVAMPLWEIRLPALLDVRDGDRVAALGNTYAITQVADPRTYEIERVSQMYLVADPADPSGAYVLANATVDVKRGTASAHYTGRRVHLSYPSRTEQAMAGGAVVPALLADLPDANYLRGDTVTFTAIDGHTALPNPRRVTVGAVDYLSGPPPLTSVQLTGLGGFQ